MAIRLATVIPTGKGSASWRWSGFARGAPGAGEFDPRRQCEVIDSAVWFHSREAPASTSLGRTYVPSHRCKPQRDRRAPGPHLVRSLGRGSAPGGNVCADAADAQQARGTRPSLQGPLEFPPRHPLGRSSPTNWSWHQVFARSVTETTPTSSPPSRVRGNVLRDPLRTS